MRSKPNCLNTLQAAGFNYEDACALRRIAMTLHRWHELECGDSDDYYSFSIVRGRKAGEQFEYDDDGSPFLERHENRPTRADGKCRAYWTAIPDRERGALKRLAAIMARYPRYVHYVQTDPRGAALYILRPEDYANAKIECEEGKGTWSTFGEWLSANYSRGIAVFK